MPQPDDALIQPFAPDDSALDLAGLADEASRRARIAAQIAAITATPEETP